VSRFDPRTGIQLQKFEMDRTAAAAKAQEEAYKADLQRRAAGGDKAALAELAGIDIGAWSTLNNAQIADFEKNIDFIGNAALQVGQLPEEQRPAAWDAYIQQGVRMGMQDIAQYAGGYSPEALNAVLAQANQTKAFIEMTRPDYSAVPFDADLVNKRDPAAIEAFMRYRAQRDGMGYGGQPQTFGAPSAPQAPQQPVTMPPPRAAGNTFTMQDFQSAVREYSNMGIGGPDRVSQFLTQNGIAVRVASPDEARSLPRGTKIMLPDGREGVVP